MRSGTPVAHRVVRILISIRYTGQVAMAKLHFKSKVLTRKSTTSSYVLGGRLGAAGQLDSGVIWGFLISTALVLLGMYLSGSLLNYFSLSSIAIVLGGTIGATMVQFPIGDLRGMLRSVAAAIRSSDLSVPTRMRDLLRLSRAVKSDGLMVLENESEKVSDPFYKLALQLAVDGQQANEIRHILTTEIATSSRQDERSVRILEAMGTYAPALGLVGTLIGLIQMLSVLNTPSAIGPAMAVALVTTFYGAILSNLIFLPLAGKVRVRSEEEGNIKNITLEGIVSIAKQENVVMLEQRMIGLGVANMRRAAGSI